MIDLTPVINACIAVMAALLLRFLVPWIRSKTTETQRGDLLRWVEIAVTAAQQLYYQESGAERKEYVIRFLEEHGFNVDDPAVDAAIEAAVLELHEALKE